MSLNLHAQRNWVFALYCSKKASHRNWGQFVNRISITIHTDSEERGRGTYILLCAQNGCSVNTWWYTKILHFEEIKGGSLGSITLTFQLVLHLGIHLHGQSRIYLEWSSNTTWDLVLKHSLSWCFSAILNVFPKTD